MFNLLFPFIYAYWCPTRFPYQMMLMSFNSNTVVGNCSEGAAYPSGSHGFTPGLTVTRWLVIGEEELLTLQEHMGSPQV